MKSAVWISYDLGIQGDYESLYAWLDDHRAKECGDSLAFLEYQHAGSRLDVDELKADLKKSVEIKKNDRVYVIYRENQSKKMKGKFIFGGRKAPIWSGYAVSAGSAETDET